MARIAQVNSASTARSSPTSARALNLKIPAFMRNNTPVYTAKGVEVVPIVDGCQTEGRLMLHDSCIGACRVLCALRCVCAVPFARAAVAVAAAANKKHTPAHPQRQTRDADKPTPDEYDCVGQKAFSKCDFPFMTSALAAQWGGGFCQRTCLRCSCAPDSGVQCASVSLFQQWPCVHAV